MITSAALLLVIVVGAFSASGITFIKLLGVGMIVALILDATIVRMLLVPAVMRLVGEPNWWAPAPLRRVYGRYGIREEGGAHRALHQKAYSAGPSAGGQPAVHGRPARSGRTVLHASLAEEFGRDRHGPAGRIWSSTTSTGPSRRSAASRTGLGTSRSAIDRRERLRAVELRLAGAAPAQPSEPSSGSRPTVAILLTEAGDELWLVPAGQARITLACAGPTPTPARTWTSA